MERDGGMPTAGGKGRGLFDGNVVPGLSEARERFGYLPGKELRAVSAAAGTTVANAYSIATFHSRFRLVPSGRHVIQVCVGTACHVKGAAAVTAAFKRALRISEEEDTDPERLFTVEEVACLGCCSLAPAVRIGEVVYGHVEPASVSDVITDFLEGDLAAAGGAVADTRSAVSAEIRVCLCSSCQAAGSARLAAAFEREIADYAYPCAVREKACSGASHMAPMVEVAFPALKKSFRYAEVAVEDATRILARHAKPSNISGRLLAASRRLLDSLYFQGAASAEVARRLVSDSPVESASAHSGAKVVLEYPGDGEPLDLEAYVEGGGFSSAGKALERGSAEDALTEIETSGLRGRGGGGFPTAEKWRAVRDASGKRKFVVCNGDEGDPGAFMDRMIMESYPFSVVEGMLIAGLTVGAETGIVYVRSEYPLAAARMKAAVEKCRKAGWLGGDIRGTAASFDIEVFEGAGGFVCGEETALSASLEGRRGTPSPRPPFPALKGLWDSPTLINNVETLANIPAILRRGGAEFASVGTASSKGTKVFALAGKIRRGGLIEVPMGTTLREIVFDIGGGGWDGREIKAAQIGGPSGGCVPLSLFDTTVDYEALNAIGAMMGSGGIVVLDDSDCMVDIAKYFMAFTRSESCGKCVFCRVGTKRMLEILEALTNGTAAENAVERLLEIGEWMTKGSLCGLGRTAANPALSAIRHFGDEFEAHVAGRCPAGKCKPLITYVVSEKCVGCSICARGCPVGAIDPKPYERHEIDPERCVRCGACHENCPVNAIEIKPRISD